MSDFKIEKIPLEGLHNTRDLGGFPAAGGRRIKPGRLLRSGELYPATEADKKVLVEQYGLRTIVDFRDSAECAQHPDPVLPGVKAVWCPIFKQEALGITREGADASKNDVDLMEGLLSLVNGPEFDGNKYMTGLYANIPENGYSLGQYGQFMEVLLAQGTGAVLWHCSAGKDRVGVGTALLLYALGVPMELILEDYQMVNTFTFDQTEAVMNQARQRVSEDIVSKIRPFFCVDKSYLKVVFDRIQAKYGSLDACLEQALGLTEEKRRRLCDLYLEPADN